MATTEMMTQRIRLKLMKNLWIAQSEVASYKQKYWFVSHLEKVLTWISVNCADVVSQVYEKGPQK